MNATVLSLFLAGASDVENEHAVVRDIVNEWNAQHGSAQATYITVTSWKESAYPEAGSEPQAIINRQVLDAADIVVGVFWTRFGTPTRMAGSGTEEEIERSIAAGKKVLVYFSDRPVHPSALDVREYQRVLEFKEKYRARGLYSTVSDLDSFRQQVRSHLARVTRDILGNACKARQISERRLQSPSRRSIGLRFWHPCNQQSGPLWRTSSHFGQALASSKTWMTFR